MKLGLLALTLSLAASAAANPKTSKQVADEVKHYIVKDHKRRGTNPSADIEMIRKACGSNWPKGCRFWEATRGKDVFQFQVLPRGRIYGIPSMFLK